MLVKALQRQTKFEVLKLAPTLRLIPVSIERLQLRAESLEEQDEHRGGRDRQDVTTYRYKKGSHPKAACILGCLLEWDEEFQVFAFPVQQL